MRKMDAQAAVAATVILPRGSGSLMKRHRVIWLRYRNTAGETVVRNSGTADASEATLQLINHAIARVEAELAWLVAGRNEAEAQIQQAAGHIGAIQAGNSSFAGRRSGFVRSNPGEYAKSPRTKSKGSQKRK